MKKPLVLMAMLMVMWLPATAGSIDAPGVGPAGSSVTREAETHRFRILDISERNFEGGPAIAVLLSHPLSGTVRHDDHLRIADAREMLKSAWVLSDDGRILWYPHVEPETAYAVTVLESLTDLDGDTLGSRVERSVTTRAIQPIVGFASEGFLLPVSTARGLPVVTVNVPAVDIEFFRIHEKGLVEYVSWRNTAGNKNASQLSNARKHADLVYTGRFELNPERNRRTVTYLPIRDMEPLKTPGVYLAVMREPGTYAYTYQSTYFLVTDIGLMARCYDQSSRVFASSLQTGLPLSGVQLSFFDTEGSRAATGETDADGVFILEENLPGRVHMITARQGEMMGVLPLRIPALDLSEFDLGDRPFRKREIFVYGPRDIYRPGETMPLSALLRDQDGRPVPAMPLKAGLFRPDGKEVRSFTWHPETLAEGETGYYQRSLEIPRDAQTGRWELKLYDNPSDTVPASVYAFQVEEFLPERMKLSLSISPENPLPADALKVETWWRGFASNRRASRSRPIRISSSAPWPMPLFGTIGRWKRRSSTTRGKRPSRFPASGMPSKARFRSGWPWISSKPAVAR